MEAHLNLTDASFLQQFAAAELPPELFSHEAHLRLAWLHLQHHGLEKAIDLVRTQIMHYVGILGAADKYHDTLTVAGVKTVHHFMQKSKADNFQEFIQEFPLLKTDFKVAVYTHYSRARLALPEARTRYLEPDLLGYK